MYIFDVESEEIWITLMNEDVTTITLALFWAMNYSIAATA